MPGARCGQGTGSPATIRTGTCPAQTGSSASGDPPSSGPPAETFAEASDSGMERIAVALTSWRVGRRAASQRPGMTCSENARSASIFSS